MRPFFESIFNFEKDSSNMAILALEGAAELGQKVDRYLVNWYNNEAKASGKKFSRIRSLSETNVRDLLRATAKDLYLTA